MSKNADTVTLGGNRFDCGPKVMKKTSVDKEKLSLNLIIKSDKNKDAYIEGFEAALEKVNFK